MGRGVQKREKRDRPLGDIWISSMSVPSPLLPPLPSLGTPACSARAASIFSPSIRPRLTDDPVEWNVLTRPLSTQKIQFVLRQTVYYLHETKASPNTLRPPPAGSIPTPFASTLPVLPTGPVLPNGRSEPKRSTSSAGHDPTALDPTPKGSEGSGGQVELGLYGRRIEAATLREMVEVLQRWRASRESSSAIAAAAAGAGAGAGGIDRAEQGSHPG